ncbi:MAG: hypothetical protein AB7V16_07265 [Vulcanibacillus sp.]
MKIIEKTSPLIKLFKDVFHIHSTKYISQSENGWIAKESYLHDDIIYNQLKGYNKNDIGVFNSYETNFIGFDIDNHYNNINIYEVFIQLRKHLNIPYFTLLNKSPSGLHAYLCFDSFYSVKRIMARMVDLLSTFKYKSCIEIKPTAYVGLRLFSIDSLIDENTFEPMKNTFDTMEDILNFAKIRRYQVSEFVNPKVGVKDKVNVIQQSNIDFRFTNGESNAYLNYVIPQLVDTKSNEEIIDYLKAHAEINYSGEIFKNLNNLNRRINCYRKENLFFNLTNNDTFEKMLDEQYFKHKEEIDNLLKSFPKNSFSVYHDKIKMENIRKFITGLYVAQKLNNVIVDNPELLAEYSSLYPFYRFETNRFCIPLSNKYFKMLSSNYTEIVKILKHLGILQLPYGRHYDIHRNSCIHYKLNLPKKYVNYEKSILKEISKLKNNILITFNTIKKVLFNYNELKVKESFYKLIKNIYIINCMYQPSQSISMNNVLYELNSS